MNPATMRWSLKNQKTSKAADVQKVDVWKTIANASKGEKDAATNVSVLNVKIASEGKIFDSYQLLFIIAYETQDFAQFCSKISLSVLWNIF